MTRLYVSTVALCALSLTTPAFAQHGHGGDIAVGLEGDQLIIGMMEDDGPEWGHVVFASEFGELPGQPNFADEPGFDSPEGLFQEGDEIGFDINRALRLWDGAFDTISPSALEVALGPLNVLTPPNDIVTPGFVFAVIDDHQHLHQHLDFTLQAPADEAVYLLELSLWSNNYLDSEPFWIVFNKGMDEPTHDAAIDWVWDNLVPAPGTAGLLALAGLTLPRRRR
ncbi:MAG: hypothetical protein ACF8NJ_07910 [Phycisphaerales bacterium JB038]